jgi:hypothetical protein
MHLLLGRAALQLQPASKAGREAAYYSTEGQSEAEGEATDLLPLPLFFAFVFPSSFIFRVFSPRIACQAPKRPNSLKQKEIDLAG